MSGGPKFLDIAQRERVIRLGYLFGSDSPFPWRVPDELLPIYREVWPDLGADRTD